MVLCDIEVGFLGDQFTVPNIEKEGYSINELFSDCCDVAIRNNSMLPGDLVEIYGVSPENGDAFLIESNADLRNLMLLYEGRKIVVHLKVVPSMSHPMEEFVITDDEKEEDPGDVPLVLEFFEGDNLCSEDNLEYTEPESETRDDYDSENDTPMSRLAKEMQGLEFKRNINGEIEFKVGQVFENITHFREVLKDYCIQDGFELDRKKNERTRVTCTCKMDGCTWRIHAAVMRDDVTFQIRTLNLQHTCLRNSIENKEATSTWIAKKLERELGQDPDKRIDLLAKDLKDFFQVEVSEQKLYRARKKGKKKVEGDYISQYSKLKTYAEIVRQCNPGSVTILAYEDRVYNPITRQLSTPIFKRFFLAFPAQKNGFLHGCRPFIGLDGCFLKGPTKGMLLSAVTLDGNNGIVPLAIMVAEGESKNSWGEFLDSLNTLLGQCIGKKLTFMSDRQKGVLDSIRKHYPNAISRYCAWHLCNNFRAKFPGISVRSLFWGAVKASTEFDFKKKMEEMKEKHKEAYVWLSSLPPEHWALYSMPESIRSPHISNNMSESFNSWLLKNRSQPILTLIEGYRRRMMRRVSQRKEKALTWKTIVTPNVWKQLELNTKESRKCSACFVGNMIFEVKDISMYYTVNLQEKTCNCRLWALSGIPCKHAVLAILWKRDDLEKYCDDFH